MRLALLAERQRIAEALSSRTIRTLFRVGLELNSVANRVDQPEIAQLLAGCVGRLDDAIDELRRLAFDLRQAGE